MTPLKDKIQDVMDESRMLVLGAEILVGFEFTATFQDRFPSLPAVVQNANTAALVCMLIVLAFLIAPGAYHQIATEGNDRIELHRFSTRIMDAALLPFALGLGTTVYIPASQTTGANTAAALAIATVILAAAFWYGPATLSKPKELDAMKPHPDEPAATTSLHDKIRQALTEARVIIPGNQALLGFQFAVILQRGFAELAPWLKWVHLVSLLVITLSTILLMTPAAFHRIAEHGEETDRFYRVTHIMVLSSLPLLALGVCGDLFIVLFKVSSSFVLSLTGGVSMLALFIGLWFGYTSWCRARQPQTRIALA